ncbi:hypothetical protein [Acaryochloris marina]|uniref:Ribosomal protein L7/L12 C-terminal domain-containing protein n=1 Tax=Acaryochloris marina (strain MBIC 11017) TaxID=329726 RepID=B0C196_ACAM1|nr:hypothetical protein [Acaryochloris marina]ABW28494.1 hypothetical protein AM1_3504 [Acaryochloris marina MBIC11017]BDM77495.1 hypothetical protein AM10699_03690 [Acaryochloris marina MBIC10699]
MGVGIILVCALFLLVIWLAFQPKQGETAANSPDKDDPPYIPPPPSKKTANFSDDDSNLSPDVPNVEHLSDSQVEKSYFDDESSPLIADPSLLNLDGIGDDGDDASRQGPIVISDDLRQQVQQLVAAGREITAVKKLRQQGMELNEARQYLDALPTPPPTDVLGPSSRQQNYEQVEAEVRRLLTQDQKIQAIKYVREQWGYGLKAAKAYVESLEGTSSPSQNSDDVDAEVRLLLSQNRKIEAIKLVRLRWGYDLKDAKNYVESLGR